MHEILPTSCILSPKKPYYPGKNKKNIIHLLSAEIAQTVINFNHEGGNHMPLQRLIYS